MINKIRLYQLKKQNLLKKVCQDKTLALLKDHLGLHSTDYVTPYISLWARVENFDPKILFRALSNYRDALRLRAFRGTIFVIHRKNLESIIGALDYFRGRRSAEAARLFQKMGADFDSLEQEILAALREQRCLTAREIKQSLLFDFKKELFPVMMRHLEFKGVLGRAGQRYLSDKVIKYTLLEDWIPDFYLNKIDPVQTLRDLSLKYIRKFGPVCLEDLCWWLPILKSSGWKVLKDLKKEVRLFEFKAREYIMAADDYDNLMTFRSPKKPAPQIHFLPYEDHYPKAYYCRDWFISPAASSLVFQVRRIELGQIRPSIWLNGEVIGRWEMEWTDTAKTSQKVTIIDIVNNPVISGKILSLIEKKRFELETFINERLVPLLKPG